MRIKYSGAKEKRYVMECIGIWDIGNLLLLLGCVRGHTLVLKQRRNLL